MNQTKSELARVCRFRPKQCRPKILVLGIETREKGICRRTKEGLATGQRQLERPLSMGSPDRLFFAAGRKHLEAKLPHRLQHPVAVPRRHLVPALP